MKHLPRKRFGQNFLEDQFDIDQIIASLNLKKNDFVVEIGPGLGALTMPLLRVLEHLNVVEIDRDLVARLQNNVAAKKINIIEADALSFDFSALLAESNAEKTPKMRIIGNLPYNISTPLLFHLASFAPHLADLTFMLQKEVVERIAAEPKSADYGRLSVMLQYRFYTEHLFDVPPECFNPQPKVNSAVIRLIPKPAETLSAKDETRFSALVAAAFSQRRKMLRNTLKEFCREEDFAKLGILPTARAEELSVTDFIALANLS